MAESARPLDSTRGFRIVVDHPDLAALGDADTVIVLSGGEVTHPGRAAIAAVRAAHHRGARIVSICTGAFVLAHAGLLDGRRATTHWRWADRLAAAFPSVEVVPDVLYVDDGDVLTSAGSAAGIDLCLHIVRTDHGAAAANRIGRAMVTSPHRTGGQAQFVDRPVVPAPLGRSMDELCAWLLEHLGDQHSTETLAARVAMSPRTFVRRFRAEVGTTPRQWLLAHRVDRARRLLEESDLGIEQIASEVGFGVAASMRPRFRERTGLSPAEYRARFRAPRAAAVEPPGARVPA